MTIDARFARLASKAGAARAAWPRQLVPAFLLPLIALALMMASAARAQTGPTSFADLAERLLPTVVNISTTQTLAREQPGVEMPEMPEFPPGSPFEEFFRDFFERNGRDTPMPRQATSLGSGFIIDPAGYVVTNNHVIAEADEIRVTLHDESEHPATVVGRDEATDLALLKIETNQPLPFATWGDSETLRVGDWVMAIGNPFGLGGTVTTGILSARARDIQAGRYDDFLQTDASINRGNSGGPMFNMAGEVVGVNTAIFSPTGGSVGIGFAIPSSLARNVIEQIKESGQVRRGWLGVNIQSVTPEMVESLGLDTARGALVVNVDENGPAAAGGIQRGDVILNFNGVAIQEMRRLPRVVAETRIGTTVPVVVWREGQGEVRLSVTIGELKDDVQPTAAAAPDQPPVVEDVTALGMTLSSVTPELREQFGLEESDTGAVVVAVDAGSAAAERGIRPGIVIREVSQTPVTSPADVEAKIAEARESGRRSILLLLSDAGDLRFVALPLE